MMRLALFLALLFPTVALADDPVVERAEARQSAAGWTISVTLSHPDTGWEHYADGWEVLAPDESVLGLRVLAHPHVSEQPFTRSLSGVSIPDGLAHVFIRARCSRDGLADALFPLALRR